MKERGKEGRRKVNRKKEWREMEGKKQGRKGGSKERRKGEGGKGEIRGQKEKTAQGLNVLKYMKYCISLFN